MVRSASARLSVRGVRIGQAETEEGSSGVSVALFDGPTPTVVDVRGGASATYDLASLTLDATFGRRWAIFFSGGSLFGLDAAAGIRDRILETGGGVAVFENPHRIAPVSGAALYDLPGRPGPLPNYRDLGYAATQNATAKSVRVGRVGAGTGALVGKYRGRSSAMRGGVGWAERQLGRGAHIGALVAVNAVGAVRDPTHGRWVAGARDSHGRLRPPMTRGPATGGILGTTLGLLVTDLEVDRTVLQRIASIAHSGLGAAIVPFHSATDGDLLFAAATGVAGPPAKELRPGGTADALGSVAAACAVEAVLTAVRSGNRPS
ncbi:MAG: P1 family peptidase [Thermoplasmata archaeon]|nr:P1 family peptidase [Thermoplasmata archaeon]